MEKDRSLANCADAGAAQCGALSAEAAGCAELFTEICGALGSFGGSFETLHRTFMEQLCGVLAADPEKRRRTIALRGYNLAHAKPSLTEIGLGAQVLELTALKRAAGDQFTPKKKPRPPASKTPAAAQIAPPLDLVGTTPAPSAPGAKKNSAADKGQNARQNRLGIPLVYRGSATGPELTPAACQ